MNEATPQKKGIRNGWRKKSDGNECRLMKDDDHDYRYRASTHHSV